MVIKPKVRGFICTASHPKGCAANVNEQIDYVKSKGANNDGPKNVLVIGASTGYGLASRITATFGYGAKTLGLFFEKPASERKTGTAGYYNSAAFEQAASDAGIYAKSINGDAFSDEGKARAIEVIKADLGKIDLVVYSLASPRRTDPKTGETYNSVLKPINEGFTAKSLNTDTLKIGEVTLEVANEQEIESTVKVMGGEDWELWIDALKDADVLADSCKTVSYTYLGDKITWPIYGKATIGRAKEDLDRAATAINGKLASLGGEANVAVLKALVTQSSAAIPIMPLYISILYKVMKDEGTHEGCIEQLQRLFSECVYSDAPRLDDNNRFRVDNLELDPALQAKVEKIWDEVTEENLKELTDIEGHHAEFMRLFGFGIDGVDYDEDLSPLVDAKF
ncbi:MAG: enoyl-[acyl-carrier protein] reductase/trans-2-enoyl-CoA reductase (NAD+) [Flavobacteriales bacterium]|jgi:enoyl-[acyl-carrier protein] reductase/trans-2-enoyl-CoA reductase (NAD+)